MCNDIIDRICSKIHSCECLNALHAIRAGHPLGIDNPYKYRNAYAMVCLIMKGIAMTIEIKDNMLIIREGKTIDLILEYDTQINDFLHLIPVSYRLISKTGIINIFLEGDAAKEFKAKIEETNPTWNSDQVLHYIANDYF